MIGLDTNVVLRYLLQDDPIQTLQVNRLLERELSPENPGFLSLPTVLEIVWVLRSVFRLAPSEIATHLDHLLATDSFVVQNEQQVFEAAYASKRGMAEFEDALIAGLNRKVGCSMTYTFDGRALRLPHFRPVA